MSSASEIVKRMLDASLVLDAAGVVACLDDNIACIEPESLPYGGVHVGLEEFRDNIFGFVMSKCTIQIGRCELIGNESKVAASMDVSFTSHRTGQSIMMPYVEIYTVENDKITHLDVYPQDTKKLMAFWEANC